MKIYLFIIISVFLILSQKYVFAIDLQVGVAIQNVNESNKTSTADSWFPFIGIKTDINLQSFKKIIFEIGDINYETQPPKDENSGDPFKRETYKVSGTSAALLFTSDDDFAQVGFGIVSLNYSSSNPNQKFDHTLGFSAIAETVPLPFYDFLHTIENLYWSPSFRYIYVKPNVTTNGYKESLDLSHWIFSFKIGMLF